jgi:hypothetical protein
MLVEVSWVVRPHGVGVGFTVSEKEEGFYVLYPPPPTLPIEVLDARFEGSMALKILVHFLYMSCL